MHAPTLPSAPAREAITPLRSARFATKLLMQEALACHATRVWLPGLYCPKVAGALKRLGLSLAYYDLDHDLAPLAPPVTDISETVELVVGFYPFGLARDVPVHLLAGRAFVLDACHALRTVLNSARQSARGPIVVSLRKEFGGKGKAWLLRKGTTSHEPSQTDGRLPHFCAEITRGHAVTRLAVAALGTYLPSVGTRDVLTNLPLLATDRDAAVAMLRSQGIEAWYWRRRLPGWSSKAVPQAARLRKSLLLVPFPHPQVETDRLLDILETFDLIPWQQTSDIGCRLQPEFIT